LPKWCVIFYALLLLCALDFRDEVEFVVLPDISLPYSRISQSWKGKLCKQGFREICEDAFSSLLGKGKAVISIPQMQSPGEGRGGVIRKDDGDAWYVELAVSLATDSW
jgi:hypothetical protein